MTSCFIWEKDYAITRELETISQGLASFIDSSLSIDGQGKFIIAYKDDCDLVLPIEIGGQSYRLILMNDAVILKQEGKKAMGHWSGFLHLWRPEGNRFSSSKIESEDTRHAQLKLVSGQPFQISLQRIFIDGFEQIQAFTYPLT